MSSVSKNRLQKKKSTRSEAGMATPRSDHHVAPDGNIPPCDTLTIKILSLRVPDEDPKHFAIKVTYFDQLILHAIIRSIGAKAKEHTQAIAKGTLNYDPSDYEKMCLFADNPLIVNIQPLRSIDEQVDRSQQSMSSTTRIQTFTRHLQDISCCNVDILAIFLSEEDKQRICVKKRMEPLITPRMSRRKSWDNLPLLTMELKADRNSLNIEHHKVLNNANWMNLTVVAAYNMYIPYENGYTYVIASKTPLRNESNVGIVMYNRGYSEPKRFKCTSFFPKWESLRVEGDVFSKGDEKLEYRLEDIQNEEDIDLPYYMNRILPYHTSVWGSFHRTLMLKSTERWFYKRFRNYKWPLELHIYGEDGGFSFMGFMNLFRLLYPGEHTLRLAVPLHWINRDTMMQECGCDVLLTPIDRAPTSYYERVLSPTSAAMHKPSKMANESVPTSMSTSGVSQVRATGADENCAFIIVEVKLRRPLKEIIIPPPIPKPEISAMLNEIEHEAPHKRDCVGRGQLDRAWQNTVKTAAIALRKVPYYGATEFCTFNRQLSETRTRVELTTSCWQDASIFINNNFVVQQYVHSDELFEELLMMAHACLMKSAYTTLLDSDYLKDMDPVLRAARQSRQMQDTHHAMELFMQLIIDNPREANYWRELSTCLKDLERDWAIACLNKSLVLDPRHPLTLVSKGAMLFEEDPALAEPFFMALLAFHPRWTTLWVIASAYFYERELFVMSDTIMELAQKNLVVYKAPIKGYTRDWEQELGDWWDFTPLMQDMSPYYDAADMLLRLRAIPLAEVCVARALTESGESPAYYHLVALCCRLRGDYKEALCHLNIGIQKYGEVSYLRSLEAECLHRTGDIPGSLDSFEKSGSCVSPFSILMSMPCRGEQHTRGLLVDLVRRQPSAYVWTALAHDFLKYVTVADSAYILQEGQAGSKTCARACAIQALRIDRRAGRAWLVLAKLVKPSARRVHCLNMANMSGYQISEDDIEDAALHSKHSTCHLLGKALRECGCELCESMRM